MRATPDRPVFITGGTGFIGRNVVRKLQADYPDRRLHLLVRTITDREDVVQLQGNVVDAASVMDAFATRSDEWEAVIHLAGLVQYSKGALHEMEQVNVEGTRHVLEAIARHAPTTRFVYMSSVAAVGSNVSQEEPPLVEDAEWDESRGSSVGYIRTKRAAENLVLQDAVHQHRNTIVLCPTQVYGYGDADKSSRRTQIKVAQGKWPFYTNGGTNVLDVRACAEMVANVAFKDMGTLGERYILAGENITVQELLKSYSDSAGAPGPSWCIPNWLLRVVCFWAELFGSESLTMDRATVSTLYHWYNPTKAQNELGLQSRPARAVIDDSVRYMKDKGILVKAQ